AELYRAFMRGEHIFEKSFVSTDGQGYSGLGPVYIRKSCIACHPSYGGRSKRVEKLDSNDSRNGYLLMIYDPESPTLALASKFFTGMTQTQAVAPFKAPIDEKGIHLQWLPYTDEHGNEYADGTKYELIYPKVTVDQDAILFDVKDFDMSKHAASIEATIGIYGVGLLDAISDEDLRAEHAQQQARGYCPGVIGADIDLTLRTPDYPGKHPGRFTYLCTRATIDDGPGSNAIWNITNVVTDLPERAGRSELYITTEYARVMSLDPDVQSIYPGLTSQQIQDSLLSKKQKPEMSREDYNDFMVWHRAVAVPAARNLDNKQVKRGKQLFAEAGCAACHRPSWKTRADYKPQPELSNQIIYPYTDLLRHNLGMKEPGRVELCRTTPLWGRGLMPVVSGHSDHLHDLRARNYEEAILWHGGEAKQAKEKFRNMPKEDRDALVKFLEAI
ncbi:MAG: c-type cytochrome, partial [Candidatus Symbiothrix sp.]|nr:c-type cytochrome [Candidatus Symbiothrix sp.]